MTRFILIRHGESEANRQGIFAGFSNPDLQNRGVKQAMLTAKYIAKNYTVDKIYSSDLQRAYKTAMCLAKEVNLEVITNKNFREINGGKWEGMKFDDLMSLYPEEYSMWLNDIGNAGCAGGETVKQLCDRVMNELRRIARENDGKTVAIATHATPIRVMQCIIETGELGKMASTPWVTNASVTVFEYNENEWKVIETSRDEHLSELKTELPSNV